MSVEAAGLSRNDFDQLRALLLVCTIEYLIIATVIGQIFAVWCLLLEVQQARSLELQSLSVLVLTELEVSVAHRVVS